MKKAIEIFDWYGSNPACTIMVGDDGKVTASQIKKVRKNCPNWTTQIEERIDCMGRVCGGILTEINEM